MVTVKFTLLVRVPLEVTTCTFPVVAPVGTVVFISEAETTVNVAAVPLKLTLVAPLRFVPRITTALPTLPEVGTVLTNAASPVDSLNAVPQPMGKQEVTPPPVVMP